MSYYVQAARRPPLGLSAGTTALVAAGGNVLIPGSGPVIAVGAGIFNALFGGNKDASRQAREQVFEQAARQGSVVAARVLIGGTQNTASHEIPMYRDGINKMLADPRTAPTMQAAQSQGAYWDSSDNETSDKMRAAVENELIALGRVVPSAGGASTSSTPATGTTATLAPVVARAGFNWVPWALGGTGVVAALLVLPALLGGNRRRRALRGLPMLNSPRRRRR